MYQTGMVVPEGMGICIGANSNQSNGELIYQRKQCVSDEYLSNPVSRRVSSYSEQCCGSLTGEFSWYSPEFVCTVNCRNTTSIDECYAMDSDFLPSPPPANAFVKDE